MDLNKFEMETCEPECRKSTIAFKALLYELRMAGVGLGAPNARSEDSYPSHRRWLRSLGQKPFRAILTNIKWMVAKATTTSYSFPSDDQALLFVRACLAFSKEFAMMRLGKRAWVIDPTGFHTREIFRIARDLEGELDRAL